MSALERLMPPVRYVETNGVRLACYDTGPKDDPVPVLFCHGFPELAFSWRSQLAALAAAGRRAIAVDQRGYGLSSRPPAVEDYDIVHLTDDLIGVLDALGVDKAIFCGHDWGGIVVWQAALRHPDRVAGVIGVNTPFMPRPPADPIAILRGRFGEDMYIVHFQKPGEADAILDRDAARTMGFMMRRPIPGMAPAGGGVSRALEGDGSDKGAGGGGGDPPTDPMQTFALVKIIEAYDPAFDPRETFLSDEEMAVFVDTFQRTGFTGGINWYRNFTRNWRLSEGVADRVEAPSLMVMAENDAVLPPSAADGMETFVPNLDRALIKGSGHWTQQEKPDEVNRVLLDWLDRRFPLPAAR